MNAEGRSFPNSLKHMNCLLIICGPTATGKTALALQLAKQFNGEILSADSRQVYTYMDVVTGKDVPKNFRFKNSDLRFMNRSIPYFDDRKTRIWGYDVVRPDEEWSVKLFRDFANIVIANMYKRGKLPIVVGGTGLYLKALTEPMPMISIPRDPAMRKKLEGKSAPELYDMLSEKSEMRALSMNESDRQNPRRLIRALETVEIEKVRPERSRRADLQRTAFNTFWIGLTINNRQALFHRIDERVDRRVGPPLWEELKFLKKKTFWGSVPSQTIGYRQLTPYLAGRILREEAIQQWKFAEHAYARRQLTWFKKQPHIRWFDVLGPTCFQDVVSRLREWYDESDGAATAA